MLWLEDLSFYKDSNKYTQTAIQNLVRNIDWSNYDFKELDYEGVKRILQDSVLTPFQIACEDVNTKKSLDNALKGLFTMDTSDMTVGDITAQVDSYINTIATAIGEDSAELKLKFGFNDTDTLPLINNVKEKLQDEFVDKVGELKIDELKIATGLEIPNATLLSWDELIAKIKEVQNSTVNENPISLSLTETIDQLNTQLKPTFDSLKSAYENIFTTDDNGKPLFTLENVDLSMLDSIKSAIDDLNENEELGISIDYTSFENLARTLTDTASTENDVRNGFNEFITDIVYGTTALDNLNASDAKLVETMLESLGVTNAHEIVYESLIAKTEALTLEEQLLSSVGGDLTNATADKVLAFLNQAGASEVARNYLIKLIAEEQVFSNQDLDVSGKISKLQELAQAYGQTALAAKIASQEKANEQSHTVGSWSEADLQQFQKEWNDGLSSVSIDFSPKSSSKSKKSGSSKSEKDLWLEEYKRKLAELQNLLAKGRLMPSPVVIQDVSK
jgi:hypothetical protein